jgi:hypothetical protein
VAVQLCNSFFYVVCVYQTEFGVSLDFLCMQAFQQYDIEDEGVVDARFMLDCIKKYVKGSSPHSDLESSIRMLQMCPLTPGKWNSFNFWSNLS